MKDKSVVNKMGYGRRQDIGNKRMLGKTEPNERKKMGRRKSRRRRCSAKKHNKNSLTFWKLKRLKFIRVRY